MTKIIDFPNNKIDFSKLNTRETIDIILKTLKIYYFINAEYYNWKNIQERLIYEADTITPGEIFFLKAMHGYIDLKKNSEYYKKELTPEYYQQILNLLTSKNNNEKSNNQVAQLIYDEIKILKHPKNKR